MNEMSILLHQTISLGGMRYRLESILGGGATAIVFLGKAPDDPDKQAAVKVAKPNEQWQAALRQEFDNLRNLEQSEQMHGTHYFPRVLAPQSAVLMPTLVLGEEYLIMAQELVTGIGVHDLTLEFQGLCLPEPLALEIACQYAEMLIVLHETGLTCADRKLADLRWQKEYDLRANNQEDLHNWQGGKLLGQLIVLDWNVTSGTTVEEKNLDLFRFGILWHRMLLGEEPRFRRGGKWQLEEPLPRHPLWRSLSIPTRRILAKLLHPFPEERYQDAHILHHDLKMVLELWQQPADGLWQQKTLEATSVMRVRVTQWGEASPPTLEKKYRHLWRKYFTAPSDRLQEYIALQRGNNAQAEIKRLKNEYAYYPAMWLHLDRLEKIIEVVIQDSRMWHTVKALRQESEHIFVQDYPDDVEQNVSPITKEIIIEMKQNTETEQDPSLKKVRRRLFDELVYRIALRKARKAYDEENWQDAEEFFRQATNSRTSLDEKVCDYLDLIYGNPTQEQEKVKEIIKWRVGIQDVLYGSMCRLIEVQTPEEVQEIIFYLQKVRRAAPRNRSLSDLRILLESELAWQQAKGNRLLEIHFLRRLQQQWESFQKTLKNYHKFESSVHKIEKKLKDRQSDLRASILGAVITPLKEEKLLTHIEQIGRFQPLLEMYYHTFPEDNNFSTILLSRIRQILQQSIRDELSISHQGFQQSVSKEIALLSNLLPLAKVGSQLAALVGENWTEEIAPTTLEQKIKEMQTIQIQVAAFIDRYFGLQSGGK